MSKMTKKRPARCPALPERGWRTPRLTMVKAVRHHIANRPKDRVAAMDPALSTHSPVPQSGASARVVDVTALIDATPAGAFQYRTIALCMAALFLDGYDTQAVGYAVPSS